MVKIVAAACMCADHAGYILHTGGLATYLTGRVAFPLFCFAAAVAILRLRDDTAHLYRQAAVLLFFAVLSEPVAQLARAGYMAVNVLFTLALGMAVAPALMATKTHVRAVVYALALAAFALPNAWEFGFAGMLLPVTLALALRGSCLDGAAALVLAGAVNFGGYAVFDVAQPALAAVVVLCATLVPTAILFALNAYYAARPVQGRVLSRYMLHFFYPAHLLVLWAIVRLAGQ